MASQRFLSSGLLAVTDKRLLYVEERLVSRPVVRSVPLDDVIDVAVRYEALTGTITLYLRDGSTREYSYVTPKERASTVAAAIQRDRSPPEER